MAAIRPSKLCGSRHISVTYRQLDADVDRRAECLLHLFGGGVDPAAGTHKSSKLILTARPHAPHCGTHPILCRALSANSASPARISQRAGYLPLHAVRHAPEEGGHRREQSALEQARRKARGAAVGDGRWHEPSNGLLRREYQLLVATARHEREQAPAHGRSRGRARSFTCVCATQPLVMVAIRAWTPRMATCAGCDLDEGPLTSN
eukprot:3875135-Pleurochrysis_carterae.AAC.1